MDNFPGKSSYRIFRLCIARGLGILLLPLFSCLPEPLELNNIPELKPQIVVASQIIPDGGLVVFLTRTFGALDASEDSDPEMLLNQIAINDAVVILSGPGGADTLELIESGFYGGLAISLLEGERYDLFVKSVSLGEVTASAEVQSRVIFDDVKAELYYDEYDDTLAHITYSLNDPEEDNWYMVNVQSIERESLLDNLINPREHTYLFYDSIFNGENYVDQFLVFRRDYQPGDTIVVSLSNIGKDYYDFVKLRMDNRYNFIEFISEPVNYPTNVVGGRGFFNLYVPDIRTFIFDEEGFAN